MKPNWRRPKQLFSKTEHLKTSCGTMHLTLGYIDEERTKLAEVIAVIGKQGCCPNIQLSLISRLLSIIIQSPLSRPKILKKFRKLIGTNCGNKFTIDEKEYTSCDDLIIKKIIENLK